MRVPPLTAALLLVFLSFTAVGLAQVPGPEGPLPPLPPDPDEILREFDRNGDGDLDDVEWRAFVDSMEERMRGGPDFGPGPGRGGRMGGPGGFGGPGGMNSRRELVKEFDADGNGRLDAAERVQAREAVAQGGGGFPGGPGGRGGFRPPFFGPGGGEPREEAEPAEPEHLAPDQVETYPDQPLYEPRILRTIFLEFPTDGWEEEMIAFHRTDVEIQADLIVDGRTYPSVGVRFRGNTSFGVPTGKKRSLNISVDHAIDGQRLYGHRTLNLLNSHTDPSFLRAVLFYRICGEYIAAPRANLVRLVINGESWGTYINEEQFNKDFLRDHYGTDEGNRWKVPQDPGGSASLRYRDDDPQSYQGSYQLKDSKDADQAWAALIRLCKALDQTSPEKVEDALEPILDIDSALWFLALDNVLLDGDGYVSRGSDFLMVEDPRGRFHLIPYDSNETFGPGGGGPGGMGGPPGGFPGGPGGRGFRGGPPDGFPAGPPGELPGFPGGGPGLGDPPADAPPAEGEAKPPEGMRPEGRRGGLRRGGPPGFGGGGLSQSPLAHADGDARPLIRALLSVPHLRARYLAHVRTIAERWLDWDVLGTAAAEYRSFLDAEVPKDTRKLYTVEAYEQSLAGPDESAAGSARGSSFARFAAERQRYLLSLPELSGPVPIVRSVRRLSSGGGAETAAEPSPREPARIAASIETSTPLGSVLLRWTADEVGLFDGIVMRDDGVAPDTIEREGIYTAEIPPQPAGTIVRYYVEVRSGAESASSVFAPERAEAGALSYQVRPRPANGFAVKINELLSTGGAGESEASADVTRDWIELYNASKDPVDLSGLFLSDDPERPRKWGFPDGTVIQPGKLLIVEAGAASEGDAPALRADFHLSRDGECLLLVDRDDRGNAILDRVIFGAAKNGASWGRLPDGQGELRPTAPTRGALNSAPRDDRP